MHHGKSKKSVSYAQIVASGKANKAWPPDELKAIKLKTADQYTLIGQSLPQLDIPAKTNGTAKYGIDAFVARHAVRQAGVPPVRYGATVKSVDESAAKKVPGFVKAVVVDDKTGTTSGWVVAVASTLRGGQESRGRAQDRLGQGPVCQRLRPVDHRRISPSAKGRHGRLPVRQGRRFGRRDGQGGQGHRGRSI